MATPISLVAEPHDDTRALYRMCLEHSGWETLEAEDGATALSLAYSHRPTLLLTELRLPRIDGYSLINLLKRDPATAGMTIVVVTADAARTATRQPRSRDFSRRPGRMRSGGWLCRW